MEQPTAPYAIDVLDLQLCISLTGLGNLEACCLHMLPSASASPGQTVQQLTELSTAPLAVGPFDDVHACQAATQRSAQRVCHSSSVVQDASDVGPPSHFVALT